MFTNLKSLRGNARACVFTEPLFGIPYNLFNPYLSVYMLALGLTDRQIGSLLSINLAFQILAALSSGVLTDKLGRRRTTFLFDLVAWTLPVTLWLCAQNFTWFLVATILNSLWRIPSNSWTCLLVEDTDPRQLMDIYSWIYIAGLLAAFFAPLAGLLIHRYTLVPAMRGLLGFALLVMTLKFFLTYRYSIETGQGQVRLGQTREQHPLEILREYRGVAAQVIRTPQTLYTIGIAVMISITMMINNVFWAIFVTQKLGLPDQDIAYFPFAKSVAMLLFFFLATPRIRQMSFKLPMAGGLAAFALSQVILITAPQKGYPALLASIVLEAFAYAALNPQLDRLITVTVNPEERARIQSILFSVVILLSSPFGRIAGSLSEANRTLPFLLNLFLLGSGILLVLRAGRYHRQMEAQTAPAGAEDLPLLG